MVCFPGGLFMAEKENAELICRGCTMFPGLLPLGGYVLPNRSK